jgi:hypothetical protein
MSRATCTLRVLPHQGPRELLVPRLLTREQRDKVLCAIGFLEDVQMSIRAAHGDSSERTTICQALAKLHQITSPHRCKGRR